MDRITVKDYGRPEYLDGAQVQFMVLRGDYPAGNVIAYVDNRDDALKIAQLFGDEVIIEGPR